MALLMSDESPQDVTIGLVTALPVEGAAMRLMLDSLAPPSTKGRITYHSGRLPSARREHPHHVVLTVLARDGTRHAAAVTSSLLSDFPSVECVLMIGIAGGVPSRVRLGDVVVARYGIIDYDHVFSADGDDHLRAAVDGISMDLRRADNELDADELLGNVSWTRVLADRASLIPPAFARPGDAAGEPTVHRGAIGSADRLVRDATKRDDLVRRHRIDAVEMEASGIAVGAALHNRSWFVVRGIADYADHTKDDTWRGYASLTAAAYARGLLSRCPPWGTASRLGPATTDDDLRTRIATALSRIEQLRDAEDRRVFLAALPPRLAAAVPHNSRAHLHLLNVVRTCEQTIGGGDALLRALRATVPADSIGREEVERLIKEHWTTTKSS
jgi:nucleoside phosphorylase